MLLVVLSLAARLLYAGLTVVAPREARLVQFLGAYTRIRNHETTVSKVNDAGGSPIEIAAVVVWQLEDTARAVFGVDDFV